jgi:hypothetical protein
MIQGLKCREPYTNGDRSMDYIKHVVLGIDRLVAGTLTRMSASSRYSRVLETQQRLTNPEIAEIG